MTNFSQALVMVAYACLFMNKKNFLLPM